MLLVETWRYRRDWTSRLDKIAAMDKQFRLQFDLRRNTKIWERRRSKKRPREDPEARVRLEEVLGAYLEENGTVHFVDD